MRPFPEWTLNDLPNASRELGVLGEDVSKFAHAVWESRNYIHPQQQVKEGFPSAQGHGPDRAAGPASGDLATPRPEDN